jgi:hypothetical protein
VSVGGRPVAPDLAGGHAVPAVLEAASVQRERDDVVLVPQGVVIVGDEVHRTVSVEVASVHLFEVELVVVLTG